MALQSQLIAFALLFSLTGYYAQTLTASEIDEIIESRRKCQKVPALSFALLSKPTGLEYAKAFGWHNINEKRKASDESIFCLASVTKEMTALLGLHILRLGRSQGLMFNETTPLKEIVPAFGEEWSNLKEATLEDALSHRTGLQVSQTPMYEYFGDLPTTTREDVAFRTARLFPFASPKEKFMYSNEGYTVAGYTSEVLDRKINNRKRSWEELLREYFFKPLGIDDEVEFADQFRNTNRVVTHYVSQEGFLREFPMEYFKAGHPSGPSGSVCMTTRAMLTYVKMLMNSGKHDGVQVIDEEDITNTWQPRISRPTAGNGVNGMHGLWDVGTHYGLGWNIGKYNNYTTISHAGDLYPATSHLTLVPELGLAFWMSNSGPPAPRTFMQSLHLDFVDILTGSRTANEAKICQPAEDGFSVPPAESVDIEEVPINKKAYIGVYTHPMYGQVEIKEVSGELRVYVGRFGDAVIHCQKSDVKCNLTHTGITWFFSRSDGFESDLLSTINFHKTGDAITGVEWPRTSNVGPRVIYKRQYPVAQSDFAKTLDEVLEEQRVCHKVPGLSLAVYSKGITAEPDSPGILPLKYAKTFGWHDMDSKKRPTEDDTLFCLASVTKHITATLALHMLRLARQNGLDWNVFTPLREIDPYFGTAESNLKEVTISDSLSHQSGLQITGGWFQFGGPANSTRRETAYRDARASRLFKIGEKYAYDNQVFGLAGYITEVINEKITGKSETWEELVKKHFFEPVGLANDIAFPDSMVNKSRIATHYLTQANQLRAFDSEFFNSIHPVTPAGGMCWTTKAAAYWIEVLVNKGTYRGKQVINEEDIDETWRPRIDNPHGVNITGPLGTWYIMQKYALGWFQSTYNGRKLVSHTGDFIGVASLLTVDPDSEIAVWMSTTGPPLSHFITHDIQRAIIDSLTGRGELKELLKCKQDEVSFSLPVLESTCERQIPIAHQNFTGTYKNNLYGQLDVVEHQGQLRMLVGRYGNASIVCHSENDCFMEHSGVMWWMDGADNYRNNGLDYQRVKFTKENGCVVKVVIGMYSWGHEVPFERAPNCPAPSSGGSAVFQMQPLHAMLLMVLLGVWSF